MADAPDGGVAHPGEMDTGGPVPLDELYDDATLALIEAHARPARRGPARRSPIDDVDAPDEAGVADLQGPGGVVGDAPDAAGPGPGAPGGPLGTGGGRPVRRLGAQGAVLAGVMLGLGEVFEPDADRQAMVEFVPDAVDRSQDPIEFVYVHGSPTRSRIIVRPWLMR